MQFDDEGVENKETERVFDLGEYLLKNGLSVVGLNKMQDDIDSGEMNVNILVCCDDTQLNELTNLYNLTVLQKIAFKKAVTLLKSARNNNNSASLQPTEQNSLKEMFAFLFQRMIVLQVTEPKATNSDSYDRYDPD